MYRSTADLNLSSLLIIINTTAIGMGPHFACVLARGGGGLGYNLKEICISNFIW